MVPVEVPWDYSPLFQYYDLGNDMNGDNGREELWGKRLFRTNFSRMHVTQVILLESNFYPISSNPFALTKDSSHSAGGHGRLCGCYVLSDCSPTQSF